MGHIKFFLFPWEKTKKQRKDNRIFTGITLLFAENLV